jgi:Protein of unknown function (DUF2490)
MTTLCLLLALAVCAPVFAATDNNANGWYMYFGDHPIAKTRWGVHLEGQWRRADLGLKWQQLLLRPGVNFQLNKKVALTGGYGFVQTHRYGDFPAAAAFPEHRFFEQATITQRLAGLDFQNRLRFEQRNIGVMAKQPGGGFQRTAWRYENRFRYQLRTNVPLKFTSDEYYLGLYDEIMFNYGKNVAKNVFDQNRAYVALGRNLGHQTRVEVGFMEQTVQHRDGLVFEHNHTLQIAIYSKLPFNW